MKKVKVLFMMMALSLVALSAAAQNIVVKGTITDATDGMLWQVVKVYTMPDHQRGVKLMRIA